MKTRISGSVDAEVMAAIRHDGWTAEAGVMSRAGVPLILAGAAIMLVGVACYCAALLTGHTGARMTAVLSGEAVPYAHMSLLVLALGTLTWLAGSFAWLRAAEAESSSHGN